MEPPPDFPADWPEHRIGILLYQLLYTKNPRYEHSLDTLPIVEQALRRGIAEEQAHAYIELTKFHLARLRNLSRPTTATQIKLWKIGSVENTARQVVVEAEELEFLLLGQHFRRMTPPDAPYEPDDPIARLTDIKRTTVSGEGDTRRKRIKRLATQTEYNVPTQPREKPQLLWLVHVQPLQQQAMHAMADAMLQQDYEWRQMIKFHQAQLRRVRRRRREKFQMQSHDVDANQLWSALETMRTEDRIQTEQLVAEEKVCRADLTRGYRIERAELINQCTRGSLAWVMRLAESDKRLMVTQERLAREELLQTFCKLSLSVPGNAAAKPIQQKLWTPFRLVDDTVAGMMDISDLNLHYQNMRFNKSLPIRATLEEQRERVAIRRQELDMRRRLAMLEQAERDPILRAEVWQKQEESHAVFIPKRKTPSWRPTRLADAALRPHSAPLMTNAAAITDNRSESDRAQSPRSHASHPGSVVLPDPPTPPTTSIKLRAKVSVAVLLGDPPAPLVNLSGQPLDETTLKCMAMVLKRDHNIKNLILSATHLTDQAVHPIIQSLLHNQCLTRVDLDCNPAITDDTGILLYQVLQINTTLRHVDLNGTKIPQTTINRIHELLTSRTRYQRGSRGLGKSRSAGNKRDNKSLPALKGHLVQQLPASQQAW